MDIPRIFNITESAHRFHNPFTPDKYATLGVLFVNVSIGGTLTHFAAPPVLMVADTWGWNLGFMMSTFGWIAGVPKPP